ncbi:MAG: transcription termination/antitermination protein NusG [Candidatus Cloacimonetes bacterium]|nr:transcription termination/antitermination protein NusG [Candidatus Cloacimonadota bacterium]
MKWYVVHTYASHEFKIKEAIEKGIIGLEIEDKIGRILIPTQKTFHIREGKRIEREKKLYNSYLIIEAELVPEVISYILGMPGITNFLGTGKKPLPLSEMEVNRLLGINERDKTQTKSVEYYPGDMVKITSGPFTEFEGVIDRINAEQLKLTVNVTVFGRLTPIEVRFDQIEIM